MLTAKKHRRLIRWSEVRKRVPYSKTTAYRLMREDPPGFPRPIRLGANIVAWDEDVIEAHIENCIANPPVEVSGRELAVRRSAEAGNGGRKRKVPA